MIIQSTSPFNRLKVRSLVLAWLFINILLAIGLEIVGLSPVNPLYTAIIYISLMITLCFWVLQRCKRLDINVKQIIGRLPARVDWLGIFGLMFAVLIFSSGSALVFFSALSYAAPKFVESALNDRSLPVEATAPLLQNALLFLCMVGVAPLTEEFIFRGIILHRWAQKWGIKTALIATSILFGFLHANVIGLSMFGLIMGLLYIKTRTLLVPIACHALNNLFAFSMMARRSAPSTTPSLESIRSIGWFGVVLLVLSLPFLLRFIRKNFPNKQALMPYVQNSEAYSQF